jgi:hypothetical protein
VRFKPDVITVARRDRMADADDLAGVRHEVSRRCIVVSVAVRPSQRQQDESCAEASWWGGAVLDTYHWSAGVKLFL